jgi:hypothetical protein
VCAGTGSSHERLAYDILDKLDCIQHYAVEAYAVIGCHQHAGKEVNVSKHAWDVLLAPPYKILLEVQGEQHVSKLDTRSNSCDDSLRDRACRDHVLASAARHAGFSVVWLTLGRDKGQQHRWKQVLLKAMQDADANRPPQLYIG